MKRPREPHEGRMRGPQSDGVSVFWCLFLVVLVTLSISNRNVPFKIALIPIEPSQYESSLERDVDL